MPVTLQQVTQVLDRDEPDYVQAASLGVEVLPHLRQLVAGDDLGLASKAAFLAGSINAAGSVHILELAARHSEPAVRVAAAASARNVTSVTAGLMATFLDDEDPGVRKWGLRSLELNRPHGMEPKLRHLMQCDPEPGLRELARLLLDQAS